MQVLCSVWCQQRISPATSTSWISFKKGSNPQDIIWICWTLGDFCWTLSGHVEKNRNRKIQQITIWETSCCLSRIFSTPSKRGHLKIRCHQLPIRMIYCKTQWCLEVRSVAARGDSDEGTIFPLPFPEWKKRSDWNALLAFWGRLTGLYRFFKPIWAEILLQQIQV